jgi:hypothetical protein
MLQELTLAWTQLFEALERLVELRDRVEMFVRDPCNVVELQWYHSAAALCREARASAVDEQIAHDLGGEGEEMRSVGQIHAWGIDEAQIGFVNQTGRVERALNRRSAQAPMSELVESVIHERHEPIASAFVSGAPLAQETCDVSRGRCDAALLGSARPLTIGVRVGSGKQIEPV